MVTVVQLVEHQVVILAVAGSSPVSHPEEEMVPVLRKQDGHHLFSAPPGPPPAERGLMAKMCVQLWVCLRGF